MKFFHENIWLQFLHLFQQKCGQKCLVLSRVDIQTLHFKKMSTPRDKLISYRVHASDIEKKITA